MCLPVAVTVAVVVSIVVAVVVAVAAKGAAAREEAGVQPQTHEGRKGNAWAG